MNTEPLPDWTGQAKQVLDESAQNLDAATLSRLNRARQRALEQARPRALRPWFVPAGLASACAVLIAVAVAWHVPTHTADTRADRRERRHLQQRSGHDVERRRFRVLRGSRFLRVARRAGKGQQRLSADPDGSFFRRARRATGDSATGERRPSATKTHDKKTGNKAAPDPDLIGFLGDYEDAADGLDPIGLSEQIERRQERQASGQTKKEEGRTRTMSIRLHSIAVRALLIAAACARQRIGVRAGRERRGRR